MLIKREIADYWAKHPNNPASSAQLAELETMVGPLPRPYRDFLVQTGPKPFDILGWCELTAEFGHGGTKVRTTVSLGWLYGPPVIMQVQKSYSVPMELYDDIGPRIPPKMLTIGDALARTSGLLLLDLSSQNYGNVWAWERVDETWATSDNQTIGFVAPDFDAMIESIRRSS